MFVIGQNLLYSGKVVVFRQKWLYSDKSDCIREKVVVFGQKLLDSGQAFVYGSKWLYSGKVVVYGQK